MQRLWILTIIVLGCDGGEATFHDWGLPADGAPALDGSATPDRSSPAADGASDAPTAPDSAPPPVDDIGEGCSKDSDCAATCYKIAGQATGLCTLEGCQAGGCPAGSQCEAHADPAGAVHHICVRTCLKTADCPEQSGGFGCVGAVAGLPGLCWSGLPGWLDVGGPDDCVEQSSKVATQRFIVVRKRFRRLSLCQGKGWHGSWSVGLGKNPVGTKEKQGDYRTPEGLYFVEPKSSSYYLALLISYPGVDDAKRGLQAGLITQAQHDAIVKAVNQKTMPSQSTALGGMIEVHGCPSGYTVCSNQDWTAGCIAVDNAVMDVLTKEIQKGDDIVITP
jgi:hypothetical protein